MPLLQSTRHIIMMEPSGFCSNPETRETNTYQADNPTNAGSLNALAIQEFRTLRDILVEHGVFVTTLKGTEGSPDDLFCNNWISTYEDGSMVLYPMLAPNRRLERRPELIAWFKKRYRLALDLSSAEEAGQYLESTGSHALDRVNKRAYVALSARTNQDLVERWADVMGYEVIFFDTRNHVNKPVYHTDVVMFIGTDLIGICADCIVPADIDRVLGKIRETHRVLLLSMDQLRDFCGNALEVRGENLIEEVEISPKAVVKGTVGPLMAASIDQTLASRVIERRYLAMSARAYGALLPDQKDLIAMYFDGGVITAPIPTIEKYGGGSVRCMLLEGW